MTFTNFKTPIKVAISVLSGASSTLVMLVVWELVHVFSLFDHIANMNTFEITGIIILMASVLSGVVMVFFQATRSEEGVETPPRDERRRRS